MGQRFVNVRAELDREIDLALDEWARREGRSKRRHLSILIRKLVLIRKSQPQELERLGLAERIASNP